MRSLASAAAVFVGLFLSTLVLPAQTVRPKPPDTTAPPSTEKMPEGPSEVLGKSLKDWLKLAGNEDPSTRERAIRTILLFGTSAQEAAGPVLIYHVKNDKDSSVRTNAVISLGMMGVGLKDLKAAVEALSDRVDNDQQAVVRYHAACALGRFGPASRMAIPGLILASKDRSSWEIRKASVFALGVASVDPKMPADMDLHALYAIVDSLQDQASDVRIEAAAALATVGKPPLAPGTLGRPPVASHSAAVVNALARRMTMETDHEVLIWLYLAGVVQDDAKDESYMAAIAKFLKDKDPEIRQNACEALGMLGPRGKAHIPELLEALDDKEITVVLAAAYALSGMGASQDRIATTITELIAKRKEMPEVAKTILEKIVDKVKGKTTSEVKTDPKLDPKK